MAPAGDQLQLHLAADILRDSLLLDVAEENNKIAIDNSRLQPACDFLGKIELRLGDGYVVSASLNHSAVIKDVNGLSCLCTTINCAPQPLSDVLRLRVSMSGQDIGSCSEVGLGGLDDEDSIRLNILISVNTVVDGLLQGLNSDDLSRLRDTSSGEEQQLTHLLAAANRITFTPEFMMKVITDDFQETIRILGPLPTFASFDTFDAQLREDPSDTIERRPLSYPDESRLAIVSALSCTELQLKLLDENHHLKDEQFRLARIEERLGTVDISHSTGKIRLLLQDGVLFEGRPSGSYWWTISVQEMGEYASVALNDLSSLESSVSGICMEKGTTRVNENTDTKLRIFEMKFRNGEKIVGDFDAEDVEGMETHEIVERMQRAFSGEQSFASTSRLKLVLVSLPLDSVKNVLDVLGVKLGETVCNEDNP